MEPSLLGSGIADEHEQRSKPLYGSNAFVEPSLLGSGVADEHEQRSQLRSTEAMRS